MMHTTFPLQRTQFDALADGWLKLGATDVSFWSSDGSLGHCPPNSAPQAYDLSAPIRMGGRTVGEVRITGFQSADAQTQLAMQAELIARLMLLETELVRAQKIQASFFPTQMPSIAGLDVFAKSRAALHVSGDYVDFLRHTPQELTFAIGDVCNKGVSAALLMAVIRKVLYTGAKLLSTPLPKEILAYTNIDMYDELNWASMFATSFIGHFDAVTRRLRYANAGHSPVIYCPAGKPAALLTADNAPLGVIKQPIYVDHELPLGIGDVLVIATDGLVEISSPSGELYGYEKLLHLVNQVRDRSAQAIAQALFDALDHFGKGQLLDDDQTLLVMCGVD